MIAVRSDLAQEVLGLAETQMGGGLAPRGPHELVDGQRVAQHQQVEQAAGDLGELHMSLAALALGQIGDPAALPVLERAAEADYHILREKAQKALKAIRGTAAG